jgi:SynChlorMet cassette radical SAM/SPASM protein ScmE
MYWRSGDWFAKGPVRVPDRMKLMNTPKTVEIAITNRCNLRCLYCYHFGGAGEVQADLPAREWEQFFEELNRCAVMDVILAGGEPFMRKDLKQLIESVVANRLRFSILTNGTLVTDEMAAFLASTRRCNQVQVSIDGSTPAVHDSCRGKGNFEKAVRGAKRLIDHGINTTVRVTIHRNNVRDLDNIARLLLEDLKLPGFSTNSATYMGLCRQNRDLVQLGVQDRIMAMESLLRLNKKYGGRISATAGPLAEARHWLEIEEARVAGKESLPGCGFLTSCNGPRTKIAVRADGVMVPCTQISHIELGRINSDSLTDVWQNHPEMKRLRERHTNALSSYAFCAGCAYVPYCRGGCPAIAYTMTGRDDHPSPDACLRQFLGEGGTLPRAALSRDAGDAGGRVAHG